MKMDYAVFGAFLNNIEDIIQPSSSWYEVNPLEINQKGGQLCVVESFVSF